VLEISSRNVSHNELSYTDMVISVIFGIFDLIFIIFDCRYRCGLHKNVTCKWIHDMSSVVIYSILCFYLVNDIIHLLMDGRDSSGVK